LDSTTQDVEALLGEPIDVVPLDVGASMAVPGGGESRMYEVGKYLMYVDFNKTGVAKGLLIMGGLTEDGYSLDQWGLVLSRIGVFPVGLPDIVAPAAVAWTNSNGYAIRLAADAIGGDIWSIQFYEIP
jgi:hypothetical protein